MSAGVGLSKGRKTFLETFKFSVYLLAPLGITAYLMWPGNLTKLQRKYLMVVYPPESTVSRDFKEAADEVIRQRYQAMIEKELAQDARKQQPTQQKSSSDNTA